MDPQLAGAGAGISSRLDSSMEVEPAPQTVQTSNLVQQRAMGMLGASSNAAEKLVHSGFRDGAHERRGWSRCMAESTRCWQSRKMTFASLI